MFPDETDNFTEDLKISASDVLILLVAITACIVKSRSKKLRAKKNGNRQKMATAKE
jgi:hypothetical protein